LVGAKSTPIFDEVEAGINLIGGDRPLSVFGYGDLGREEWGHLTYTLTNGESHTFRKGGVVSWSPTDVDFKEIVGEADVDLVAYLLSAKTDSNQHPISMVLKKKWRISKGPFILNTN